MTEDERRNIGYAVSEKFQKEDKKIESKFSKDLYEFLHGGIRRYEVDGKYVINKLGKELKEHLVEGGKPSDYFKKNVKELTGYIDKDLIPYMYKSMDSVDDWQLNWNSYYRQSFRNKGVYSDYFVRLSEIVEFYRFVTNIMNYDAGKKYSLAEIITQNVSENLGIYLKNYEWERKKVLYYLAALLDEENPEVEDAIEGIFYRDEGIMDVSYIRAMVMSHNKKIYEILGKTLLAAKLSEGLRQAICENIDFGTADAFKYMLSIINDNNLIRFASVKRAIMTFTGLGAYDTKDVDRVTSKELGLIVDALNDDKVIEEYLKTEDSMKIYIGLWASGSVNITNSFERAYKLCMEGTDHQRKTACFFLKNIEYRRSLQNYSKEIVKKFKEDKETLALIFSRFMGGTGAAINSTIYPGNSSRFNCRDEYKKKVYADYTEYFESEQECREFYDLLKGWLDEIPKKGYSFEPSVFPWNKAELKRSDIAVRMIFCASALKDKELIIQSTELIKDVTSGWDGNRTDALELLLREPDCPELLKALTKEVSNADTDARNYAYMLLKQELEADRTALGGKMATKAGKLPEFCYDILEDQLRSKREDIRSHVIELLSSRGPEEKLEMLERLFKDGKEEKVTAGLDIIMQLKKDDDVIFSAAAEKIKLIEKPTTKESILINEIQDGASEGRAELEAFYDEKATYTPVLDADYIAFVVEKYLELYPGSDIVKVLTKGDILNDSEKAAVKKVKSSGDIKEKRLLELVEKLSQLIDDNKDREYQGWDGPQLLGNGLGREYINGKYGNYPFLDLWDDFKEKNKITDREIEALCTCLEERRYKGDIKGYKEFFNPMLNRMFGLYLDGKKLDKFKYLGQIGSVFGYYFGKTEIRKNRKYYSAAAALYLLSCKDELIYKYKAEQFIDEWRRSGKDKNETFLRHILLHDPIKTVMIGIREDIRNFPINHIFMDKIYLPALEDGSLETTIYGGRSYSYEPLQSIDFIKAAAAGVISKDYMYKMLLSDRYIADSMRTISSVIRFVREASMNVATRNRTYSWHTHEQRSMVQDLLDIDLKKQSVEELTDKQQQTMEIVDEAYKNISDLILGTELVRGDTETEYSKYIYNLSRVYGVEYLVRILSALGKDTLDRNTYHYTGYCYNNVSKKESLSHLLSVCIPDPKDGTVEEQTKKLKKLVKETDIGESRLIEAGLFSPEWLPIIGQYLGWEGFTSGCYYFMAHMNENFDDKRKAVIAKYTPLTPEELNTGAFDVDWFKEVYEKLGKKRFDAIYKAAKYISDGAKHSRARKYADAARGEMDAEKTAAEIESKRNKDLLMAYALIPGKKDETVKKYQFIQKFLKSSKQFGAQRRASEKAASEMAVKNLAKVEGYDDETRFILKMERKISSELMGFLEPHEVGEYAVWLEPDDSGKVALNVEKAGKKLKSVPASLKKDEYIVDIGEAKKTFTEQYRRTKLMMEESMEGENEYYVSEILDMAKDPVIGKLVGRLLFKKGDFFGFPEDIEAEGFKGTDTVIVAHPYHLYNAGRWHEFQKLCFDRQIKQPFKQIFRELYVMTDEEKNLTESRRYAGNQINPKQTVGALRNRRWIADEENGLQKIYYKENIIATIYALADWFSPSDIEAPTLEWVAFYDRKTFERKPICEIPDIIFSEVMRDVDLAVSVAHAGQIDPEMSHSTIEMRKAIAEFVVPMFKLDNVTFTDSHAIIKGTRGNYTVHLGSGVIHQEGGPMINVLPVHSQSRGRIFLPFVDDDPKTSEIMSKIIFFAEDKKIKDPFILDQIV
ncbi:DUF4132 domain-containing protein [Eubacterium ruminantium]|uniref:DUF4132 domain-containing protein n=1 Tax=Eubacterium ruminantium TaxID=42322 RepID=UPI001567EE73|nr:DUF4132 domain-containing protein [Eubacterium ruminantium]